MEQNHRQGQEVAVGAQAWGGISSLEHPGSRREEVSSTGLSRKGWAHCPGSPWEAGP